MEAFGDQWYEAELARSSRSKCKEFRCKQNIDEGELRIGVKIEENDHSGDCLGWYHPKCLWKTFYYKSHGNVRIQKVDDVRNFHDLDEDSQKIIRNLISTNNSKKVYEKSADKKDELKASSSTSKVVVDVPKPRYAMAGTIIFCLDQMTQDIVLRGDIGHVSYRMLGAGGHFRNRHQYAFESFVFSTQQRSGAREFLCMPDDLPPAGVDVIIDLAELGRKQARLAGAEISAEDQLVADELLASYKAEADRQLLSTARGQLSLLNWGGTGATDSGRGKRVKRNDPAPEVAPAAAPSKQLPASVDELCYEARLDLSKFTIPDFKKRLTARGLSTTGNREALEARFLLAGADYLPIKDLREYTALAKGRFKWMLNAPPGQEKELIDTLLARCAPAV